MEWLAFAGSVLGGLIGGLFTFFGVKMTIKHEDKKKERERIDKAIQEKPRLEVVSFKDFKETAKLKTTNIDCNVLVLGITEFKDVGNRPHFYYNELSLYNKNLAFVEYVFRNTGFTEIESVCITSNLQKSMALVELEKRESYINRHLLNYDVWSDKTYIKQNEILTLRIYYVKDQIPTTIFGSPELVIWLIDVNGRHWKQSLNSPSNEIGNSILSSSKEFRNNIDVKKAIECFRNPIMW